MPLVSCRAWNSPACAEHAEQAVSAAPATPAPADQLRAFDFTLACPAVRDDILRKIPGLKNLDCQAIFGATGAAKLSANALWPDPVLKLLQHATALYKQLNHLRPLVKNLTVFKRSTKNGQLLSGTCEADINALAAPPS